MSSQQLRVQMAGSGPYGFRLLGGDRHPLSVSKIRPSSKAQVAGLLEGDVILAINGISCHGLGHSAATGLLESNGTGLTVLVLRGKDAISEAASVISSLGPSVRRLSEEEAKALGQRHSSDVQSASDNYGANGFPSDNYGANGFPSDNYGANGFPSEGGSFRLSAPPSSDSLKQIRVSRRESRSDDRPTPTIVVDAPGDAPGFYTREERTSTDGGKTTRIVEEVKTEKLGGGTTVTKMTKQEFTSYSNSSPGMPTYSVIRSEEQGQPVSLGSFSTEGNSIKDQKFRDERGWTMTSNVERRSVKTQPFEGHIRVTQEPATNWVVYQDDGGRVSSSKQGPTGNQPIPAIEIHFEPDETGFVKVNAIQPASTADSNFKIRLGNEINFQPKVQVQSGRNPNRYEIQTIPNAQTTYQRPGIVVERTVLSNQNSGQRQPYATNPQPSRTYHDSMDQSGASGQRIQENSGRGFSQDRENMGDVQPSHYPPPQATNNPGFPLKSSGFSSEHESSYQARFNQPQLTENSGTKYQSPGQTKQNYEWKTHSDSRQLNEYKQQPVSTDNSSRRQNRQEDEQEHTSVVHHPNQVSKYTIEKTQVLDSISRNADDKYATGQYGYDRVPEPPNAYSSTGYGQQSKFQDARLPFGQDPEGPPRGPYDPAPPQNRSFYAPASGQQRYGTYPSHPVPVEPTQDREPIVPQRLPGIKDVQSQKVTWKQQVVPDRGLVEPDRPIVPAQLERFGASKTVKDGPNVAFSTGRQNIRQPDMVDRVEFGSAQKWTPGSKLPVKQPVLSQGLKGQVAGDFRNNPEVQRGHFGDDEGGCHLATDDGWYEGAPVESRGLPGVALSRVYDPRTLENQSAGRPMVDDADYGYRGTEYRRYPDEEQSEWSAQGPSGHLQGAKSTWKPSNENQGSNFYRHPNEYDEDWQRAQYPNEDPVYGHGVDPRNQPPEVYAAHPPAPPFMPGMMGRPQPPTQPPTQAQEPRAPPPPAAPPIDHLKVYRGNADRSYGSTTLEERVKVANTMAHSVLAPENRNSRGQKMFLRRRDNSHKWTTQGPDPVPVPVPVPVPEMEPQKSRPDQPQNTSNAWAPRIVEQKQSAYPPHAPSAPPPGPYQDVRQGRLAEAAPGSGSAVYSLADDVSLNSGRGGQLFAMRRAKSEKWRSYESPGAQSGHPSPPAQSGYGVNGPIGKGHGPSGTYGSGPSPGGQASSVGAKWNQQPTSGGSFYSQGPQNSRFTDQSHAPIQDNRRLQGAPAFSSSSSSSAAAAPPYGQPMSIQPKKFGPQKSGYKATIGQDFGYTDL